VSAVWRRRGGLFALRRQSADLVPHKRERNILARPAGCARTGAAPDVRRFTNDIDVIAPVSRETTAQGARNAGGGRARFAALCFAGNDRSAGGVFRKSPRNPAHSANRPAWYGRLDAFAAVLTLVLAGCGDNEPKAFAGYVEADLLYMAAQDEGVVAEVAVREGDAVMAGDLLFRIDPARMALQVEQAEAEAKAAAERVGPGGSLAKAVADAEAQYENARRTHERSRSLLSQGVVTQQRADNDRAAFESASARLAGARAERETAERDAAGARSLADLWRKRLADLAVKAPEAGTIERVYRRAGELAAPGDPVVALLPPENRKLRFFAPEPALASLAVGSEVVVSCDRCPENLRAIVTYVASEPQFTPPVIYSLEERSKLVFLIEARPVEALTLPPGMPVTVAIRESGVGNRDSASREPGAGNREPGSP